MHLNNYGEVAISCESSCIAVKWPIVSLMVLLCVGLFFLTIAYISIIIYIHCFVSFWVVIKLEKELMYIYV